MVENIKDLEKLLKLCRKQGVLSLKWGNVEFNLGDAPQQLSSPIEEKDSSDTYSDFPPGELSPEQLMYYSAGGSPDKDPFRKD